MATTTFATPAATARQAVPAHLSRTRLFGTSIVFMLTWPVATVLFCVWITAAALSPITVFIPVLLAVTVPVRGYVNLHRRWAEGMLGEPIPAPYRRPAGTGWVARVRAVLTDRATWRDQWWLLVHSTAGATLATVSFTLLASAVFYASYPFLFWVTPDRVFRQPFGDHVIVLHSVAQSCALMPLALVFFALWFVSVRPIALAQARLARALLR